MLRAIARMIDEHPRHTIDAATENMADATVYMTSGLYAAEDARPVAVLPLASTDAAPLSEVTVHITPDGHGWNGVLIRRYAYWATVDVAGRRIDVPIEDIAVCVPV